VVAEVAQNEAAEETCGGLEEFADVVDAAEKDRDAT
jgi:hypothetical protein